MITRVVFSMTGDPTENWEWGDGWGLTGNGYGDAFFSSVPTITHEKDTDACPESRAADFTYEDWE